MIKIVIVGFGNIGKAVMEAVEAAKDMELCGIVMRAQSLNKPQVALPVVDDVQRLEVKPEVAILCTPSRTIPEVAEGFLTQGINTIDSYDIHNNIWELRQRLNPAAQKGGSVAIVSTGFDPGGDSVIRALFEAFAPQGQTFTNFGPGMSLGHTVAIKAVEGVKDALSITIPLGTGVHRRLVYVDLLDGYKFEDIAAKIKDDSYFRNDETHIYFEKNINSLIDVGHGVNLVRKGVSGKAHNQQFVFDMRINNPALTSQVMVACARASVKQNPGAYTMIEIPVIDMLDGNREELVRRLV
ncbi:MAG: diaminopimelate dehydrogenase [Defluviitaleaceae bacterium]|nr:diaminopimelate dehydrogenase [Defluviitaleaceae bacterium]